MIKKTRLWHDDLRPAPEGWLWARTNGEAKFALMASEVVEISMDHDLGFHDVTLEEIEENEELIFRRGQSEETGYDLVCWMIENDVVPEKITIHSWNPDGAKQMAARFNRFGHDCVIQPYVVKK